MKESELKKMILALLESKLKTYSETTVQVWYDLLKGELPEALNYAFKEAIRSSDDFPSVGKLIDLVKTKTPPKVMQVETSTQRFIREEKEKLNLLEVSA